MSATEGGPDEVCRAHTDGAARGNPGPAGAVLVIYGCDGRLLGELGRALGIMTNNRAEYLAVHAAFELLAALPCRTVHFCLDSELVVKQLQGRYKVRDPELATLHG